jgi:protein TonB
MTSGTQHLPDNPAAARARHGLVANLLGEVVPARLRGEPLASLPSDADLSNVVLLFRQRRSAGESATAPLTATLADRTAERSHAADRWIVAFLAASLAVHAGLAAWFNQPPPPLASIGVVSITAEIVLGADIPAGLASKPTPSEAAANSTSSSDQSEDKATTDAVPAEVRPIDERRVVERQVVPEPPSPPAAPVPDPVEAAGARSEIPTPAPVAIAELPPENKAPERKVERPPEPPPPEPRKPPEPQTAKPIEKPVQPTTVEHPIKRETQRHAEKRGKRKTAAVSSVASSGVGRGRSDASTNYRGIVAAHLGRHKQYPADARARSEQGTATVSFSIDGGGRVTRVALVRQTGMASLDQESLAMVRRASPFPPPPGGQPMSFTVPVSFALH